MVIMGKSGIPVAETLAKMANTTKTAIMEMAKKGVLGANILNEVFAELTSKGGLYNDQINKNIKDLDAIYIQLYNSLHTIFKNIGAIIGSVVKVIGPPLIEKLNKFGKWIKLFSETYPTLTKIAVIIAIITAVLGPLAIAISSLLVPLSALMIILKSGMLGAGLPRILLLLLSFSGPIGIILALAAAIIALGLAIDALLPKLKLFDKFKEFSKEFSKGFPKFRNEVYKNFGGEALKEGMTEIGERFLYGKRAAADKRRLRNQSPMIYPLTSLGTSKQGMLGTDTWSGGTRGFGEFGEEINKSPMVYPLPKSMPSMGKGQTDINIKVTLPNGMQGTVTDIKNKGNGANVDFMQESYLGPSFNRIPGVR
jgi:hypothetical protein